jgi:hypothetical protein
MNGSAPIAGLLHKSAPGSVLRSEAKAWNPAFSNIGLLIRYGIVPMPHGAPQAPRHPDANLCSNDFSFLKFSIFRRNICISTPAKARGSPRTGNATEEAFSPEKQTPIIKRPGNISTFPLKSELDAGLAIRFPHGKRSKIRRKHHFLLVSGKCFAIMAQRLFFRKAGKRTFLPFCQSICHLP